MNSYLFFLLISINFINSIRVIDSQFDFKVSEIHRLLNTKRWNCSDFIHYFLDRSYRYNPLINAIINYNPKAVDEAHALDKYYHQNNQSFIGKLHCIPIVVKDNIDVRFIPTTGGIKALRYSVPNIDATVIEKLRLEGAIVIAKANLAELAAGKYESELGGSCKNPWDLQRKCGSSSAGAGASIAAGMGVIGIGFDTEGSMMNPSTACGVYGTIPVFEGQDTVGPIARCIDDIVLSYSIMMGRQNIYNDYKNQTKPKLKIGYFKRFYMSFNITNDFGNFSYSIDDGVNKTIQKAFQNLKEMQQEIVPIEMPLIDFKKFLSLSVEIVIASTSAISACAQEAFDKYFQDKLRFESDAPYNSFGKFIESPLLTKEWKNYFSGTTLNDTRNECKMKRNVYNDFRKQYIDFFESWFNKEGVDVLAFPTSNTLPYKFNETDDAINVNPSVLSPFLGYPSLNIPIGFSNSTSKNSDGLPIGMLMLTKRVNLLDTLKITKEYESIYLNETKVPQVTPIIKHSVNIQLQCFDKLFFSSSIMLKSSITSILFFCFLNFT